MMTGQGAGADSAGGGQLDDTELGQVAGGRQTVPGGKPKSWADVLTDADLVVPFDPAPDVTRPK